MDAWTPLTMAALLTLALPASAGPVEDAAALSARCDFAADGLPNSSDALLVLTGVATAPGALLTDVSCELLDGDGGTVLATEWALPGGAAAGANSTAFSIQVLTVCTSAYAIYPDASMATLPRTCVTP
jgi:hypothetical protein